jgi:hypothetical protein
LATSGAPCAPGSTPATIGAGGDQVGGAVAVVLVDEREQQPAVANLALQLRRRADFDQLPLVDDRDPVAGAVGLLQVLRGKEIVIPPC